MTKTERIELFAILMLCLACINATVAFSQSHVYAKCAVVTSVDYDTDTAEVTDMAGYVWAFTGVEDFLPGDVCSFMMYDNLTADITDDIILGCPHYEGWIY